MPIPRNSAVGSAWVPRQAESDFAELLKIKKPYVVPLTGAGGAGKTSLLHRFMAYCLREEVPVLSLDLTKLQTVSALDVLMQVTTHGTLRFDARRQQLRDSYETMSSILQSYGAQAEQAADLLQKSSGSDTSFGTVVDTVVGAGKALHTFWQREENKRHKALLRAPEESLLRALSEDFEKGGVLLIDTMEQAARLSLQTKLSPPKHDGDLATGFDQQATSEGFLEYLARIAFFLFDKPVLMVLAGRPAEWNAQLLGGLSQEYFTSTLEAPPFTEEEVGDYVRRQLARLPPAAKADVRRLREITRGNPFLLERVVRLIGEWKPDWRWEDAQWHPLVESYRRDNRHGLLLFVTQRLLTHVIENDTAFWRLALPRQSIHRDIALLLFPREEFPDYSGEDRLSIYENKGLIYRGQEPTQYFLHDETREALQAWAEHGNHWMSERACILHSEIGEWLKKISGWPDNYPNPAEGSARNGNPLLLEAAYHCVMADAEFEARYSKDRARFWQQLSTSISLTNALKLRAASALPNLSQWQIDSMLEVFSDETVEWGKLFSSDARAWLQMRSQNGTLPVDWVTNIEFLQLAVQRFPEEGEFLMLLARQLQTHAPDMAEPLFLRAIEATPDKPERLLIYASFLQKIRGRPSDAEIYYLRAIAADPKDADSLGTYATFLHEKSHRKEEAETFYLRAIKADFKHANNLGNYAVLLQATSERHMEAEVYFLRAIVSDPGHANNLGNYARFLQPHPHRADEVEHYYHLAIEADPYHIHSICMLAFFLSTSGRRNEEADALYKRAIELAPDNSEIHRLYGWFHETVRGRLDDAEKHYRIAVEADPEHAENAALYAIFLHTARKDNPLAETAYRRAIELNPDNANCLGNLAQLVLARGEHAEGRALIDRAFAAKPPIPLQLELWFYRFAHFPQDYPETTDTLEALLAEGVRSPGWDLSITLAQAKREEHPDQDVLETLANRLSSKAPAEKVPADDT